MLLFPLNVEGPLAVRMEPMPRVEPLSIEPSEYWDILIGQGRLENVSEEAVRGLRRHPSRLFRIAAAYACFTNGYEEELQHILRGLRDGSFNAESPDFAILTH